jgi:N-carbamoyl-L-amino-acid hydrolase
MSAPSTPRNLDTERLWRELMALGEITEPSLPYTRRSFSPMYDEGRAFLKIQMRAAGLKVRVDEGGNLIGRLEGADPTLPAIVLGSHSDTVPAGGRFDGVAGVVAALEVVRTLAESGEALRHPVEVIDFLAEEPSPFGVSCIGSRAIAGMLPAEMLAMTDERGRTLADGVRAVGGVPERIADARRSDIAAFLELHIEQGPILEAEQLDVGVVTSIVGIRRLEIQFTGTAAHAGTAPMDMRRDAGFAGALAAVKVRERAEALSRSGEAYFVATVGIVEVKPGGSNVVPGECRLVIDARSSDHSVIERFTSLIETDSLDAARIAHVDRSDLLILSDGIPAACAPAVQEALQQSAAALGLTQRQIASGAGHDAAFLARVCPVGMLFIPCLDGRSHTPAEWATSGQVGAGAAVLLAAVRRLDASLD